MTLFETIEKQCYSIGMVLQGDIPKPPKIIVPLSGGKDSQATLMLALLDYPSEDILALSLDTGFEHPITYKHIETITNRYSVPLAIIQAGTVLEKCLKYKRFPGGGARHCTDELKIRPSKFFYKFLATATGQGFEVWLGMRSNESKARELRYKYKVAEDLYKPNDVMTKYPKYLATLGVMFKLPILDWSKEEIFEFLNGEENYLYSAGFSRVGCFPCLAGGEMLQVKAYNFDEIGMKHYKIAELISITTNNPVFKTKKYSDYVCAICNM